MSKYNRLISLSAKQFARRLLTAECPVFVMHRRPDGDTVGSATALMLLAKALGKETYGLCADPIPERLSFLCEGLTVKTVPGPEKATFIAVDVASREQLGAIDDLSLPFSMMLDHHVVGTPFADHLLLPNAAAAGEAVYEVAKALLRLGALESIPQRVKYNLYVALSSDTGCFRYSNVTPKTLRCAAALLENGDVDAAEINHRLFETKSEKQLRAEAYAIEHTEASPDGKIAWVVLTNEDRIALGVEEEHLETVIDMVRSRAGVEIAIAVREQPNGALRASMRSTGFDVSKVASHFGGGGHLRAAGCTVTATSPKEALSLVLSEIDRLRKHR